MSNILIEESLINEDEKYMIYKSDVYETFTDNIGDLFKRLQREYGRCVGYVYKDINGVAKRIGWVFQKKFRYRDCNELYLQSAWIILHEVMPVKQVINSYKYL